MKKQNRKFTKESTLAEILKHQQAEEILSEYKVPCIGCPFAKIEMEKLTIEKITKLYGIDLEGLLKKLNQ